MEEVNTGKGRKLSNSLRMYMSYVLPAIIVVVYLKGYYDTFSGKGTPVLIGWMVFAMILLLAIFGVAMWHPNKEGKEKISESSDM